MKAILFVLLLSFLVTFAVNAQKNQESEDKVFTEVDVQPVYPGGDTALFNFISENVKYPVQAQENGIQGKVYIEFIIDKTGAVTNAKVYKGVNEELDKEALRVIKLLKKWTPGKNDGKPVNVKYCMPIFFLLG